MCPGGRLSVPLASLREAEKLKARGKGHLTSSMVKGHKECWAREPESWSHSATLSATKSKASAPGLQFSHP